MVHSNDNTVIRVLLLDVAGQTELNQVRFSILSLTLSPYNYYYLSPWLAEKQNED